MDTPADPRKSLPTTYFVQDQSNREELQRLCCQDQMLTTGMGGVLSEQPDPAHFARVLDVGCGTGGWLVETAKAYPTIAVLCGVDANKRMIDYARAQAKEQYVSDRVEFHVMDVLRMIEFPDQYFDLVNQRLGESFLRTWEWRKLLQEYQRVCRPGGIIRMTEADLRVRSNSPALECLFEMVVTAFYQAGYLLTPDGRSVLDQLVPLLRLFHIQQIQTRTVTLEYRAGTPEWCAFAEDMSRAFQTIAPFLRKWARIPDDYTEMYQQAMTEIGQPDFVGRLELLTAWGTWMPE